MPATASPAVSSTIGLKNMVIAPLLTDTESDTTYGTLQKVAGAIEASVTPGNADPDVQYGDDVELDVLYPDPEISFKTKMADIPLAIQEMIFSNKIDDHGVLIRTASDKPGYFAVGFCSEKSNGKMRYIWLYNDYGTASTVSLTSLSGLSGTVTGYTQGNNVSFDAAALSQLNGTVTTITISPDAVIPVVETTATVKSVNFEEGSFTNSGRPDLEFEAGATKSTKNFLGLQDFSAPQVYENLSKLATAIREYNAAVAAGDTDLANAWADSAFTIAESVGADLDYNGGVGFQAMAQYIANGMQVEVDGECGPITLAALEKAVDALMDVKPTGKNVKISGGNCFIRTGPNTAAKDVGVAHKGDVLPYAGEIADNGWLMIVYKNKNAWVSGKYSKLIN